MRPVALGTVARMAGVVIGVAGAMRVVAMHRHAVEPGPQQDGEQEARQWQHRDERDQRLDGHRLIP
jgi:hypothetical protein